MINYIEFLNMPATVAIVIVSIFFILQIIGEILEFKGKVVPEFIKVRKFFIRKKQERQTMKNAIETLERVKTILNDVDAHYSTDNIKLRNNWMQRVDDRLEQNDELIKELNKKLDINNHTTLDLLIDSKRNTIINFASTVVNKNTPVTREQFNRIIKMHEDYEKIIERNGLTNGEVDIAFRIIEEAYEEHMKNHTFIEDIRGYNG